MRGQVNGKEPERLIIPEAASAEARKITALLLEKLGLAIGKEAIRKWNEFKVRHTILNSMHTLLFFVDERSVSGITFWLDEPGKGVTSVSILTPHDAGGAPKLPQPVINYLESIRRIARKHPEASFMNGPGAGKNPPQARRH
jgi:hypothetical protein